MAHLNDGFGSGNLKDLASSLRPVGQPQVDNLGELGILDIVQDDEGSIDTRYWMWDQLRKSFKARIVR